MAFHDRPYDHRFQFMGDEAEGIYEAAKPMGNTVRFGWSRPKGINFKKLPEVLRHMPDYYAQAGYFVEVMGLGKDGVLKSLKVVKYQSLKQWAKIARMLGLHLAVFIWNSSEKQYITLLWTDVVELVARSKKKYGILAFSDGNEYHPIPWEWLVEKASWVSEWDSEA